MWLDARFLLDLCLQLVVGRREHSAIRVVDQDDLAGAQKTLRDSQGSDLVVGYDASGVANHVRVTLLKPQHTVDVQARVHAGDHGHTLSRGQREVALVERLGVSLVVVQQLVGYAHGFLSLH
jgi:hypothetical protein